MTQEEYIKQKAEKMHRTLKETKNHLDSELTITYIEAVLDNVYTQGKYEK